MVQLKSFLLKFEDILECGKATEFDRLKPCNIIQVSTILSFLFSETCYQFVQRRNAFIYMIIVVIILFVFLRHLYQVKKKFFLLYR